MLDLETSALSPARQDAVHFLRKYVLSVRDGLRRRATVRAALWAVAALVATLAAALMVDAAVCFTNSTRVLVYLALTQVVAGLGSVFVVRTWLRKPSALFIARMIERRRGDLKNTLITFLELQADPMEDPNTVAVIGVRAARILSTVDTRTILPPYSLRRPGFATVGAMVMLGAILWLTQGILFDPWIPGAEASLVNSPFDGSSPLPSLTGRAALDGPGERLGSAGGGEGAAAPGGSGESPGGTSPGAGEGSTPGDAQALASAMQADVGKLDRLAKALGMPRRGARGHPEAGAPPSPDAPAGEAKESDAGQSPNETPGAGDGMQPEGRGGSEGMGGSENPATGHAKKPVIPEVAGPKEFPQDALDSLRSVQRIIDQADRRLREGEASNTFLGDIGMSREEFRRFVVGWQKRLGAAAAGSSGGAAPSDVRQIEGGARGEVLQRGGMAAGAVVRGTEAAGKDATDLFIESDSEVSGRLQPAVSAYFEALDRAAKRQ